MNNTIWTSNYGSELMVIRIISEFTVSICCKLRIIRVQIYWPAMILGEKDSIETNWSIISSASKKNQNNINYHKLLEDLVAELVNLTHILRKSNLDDILTKPLGPHNHCPIMKEFLVKVHLILEGCLIYLGLDFTLMFPQWWWGTIM